MNSNDQQIFNSLKNVFPEFRCTLQDLRNPTEDFVINLYFFWLKEFGVDVNNINQVQFGQAAIVHQYQDAYSNTISKTNLLRCMKWFDVIPDFGILDIVSPTPRRTQNNIRYLLEFFEWADGRVCQIQDKQLDLKQRKIELAKLVRDQEAKKEALNNITKHIATIQDENQQLETEIQQLHLKTSDLKVRKQKAKSLIDECNEKLKVKETALQKLKKDEAAVVSKIKEHSSLIVDSPSSILSEMENLQMKCNELSELSDQKKEMVESKLQGQKKMEDIVSKLQHQLNELNELLKLIDQHRKLDQKVCSNESENTSLHEALSQLKTKLIAVTNKKKNRQETLQSLYLKWKVLKPQLTESVEAAIRELNEKREVKSKMVNSLKEDAAVQENIDTILKKIRIFVEDFQNDYELFQKQKEHYFQNIEEKLQYHMQSKREEFHKLYKKGT